MQRAKHRSGADDYCYLTTTGRRTGRPHRIEIWYAAHGDTLYLLSGGGRSADWVQNLCADPAVLVEVDGDVRPAPAGSSRAATRPVVASHRGLTTPG